MAKEENPNVGQYQVVHEADSLNAAAQRTQTAEGRSAAYQRLMEKDGWDGVDNDTAFSLLAAYMRQGDRKRMTELSLKQRQMATQSGQMVQSFAKYSRRDASVAVADAIVELDGLRPYQVDRSRWIKGDQPKRIFDATTDIDAALDSSMDTTTTDTPGGPGSPNSPNSPDNSDNPKTEDPEDAFRKWKEGIADSLIDLGIEIEDVEDGDVDAMRDIVRQIANFRRTTAWFGLSSDLDRRAERGLA